MANERASVCMARMIFTPEVRITVKEASTHTALHHPACDAYAHHSAAHQSPVDFRKRDANTGDALHLFTG